MQPTTYILLINCPDRPGIIYQVSNLLYSQQANIVANGEFVEREHSWFFMRTEFSGVVDAARLQQQLADVLPPGAYIHLAPARKKRIVVLATKEYHCLGDLLLKSAFNDLNVEVACVISNYEVLRPLTEQFGVPFYFVDHQLYSRADHEAAVDSIVNQYTPDLVVLAKYMRILSPGMVQKYHHRIINIHHSFLPAFIGANPYRQAYDRGVKIIGATAHFVTEALDEGPIIAQSVITVDHTHNAREMAQAGRDVEKNVLAQAIKLVSNQRVFVFKNKTVIFD